MTPEQEKIYEDGFIAGMQKQMQSSVDKAVNAMTQRTWVGLTDEEIKAHWLQLWHDINQIKFAPNAAPQKETVIFLFAKALEATLKECNA
jgi:hypothetical protein